MPVVVAVGLLIFTADAPLPPAEAPGRMTLPPGFHVTLFAGEPDVVQPIATAFDDRGRLWVCECVSYPDWVKDPKQGRDRIVIFEDQNGDGKFSKRTVFADNLQNLTGIELGYGGVYLCSTPNLVFIPIDASGDKPAGPPQVLLDGWDIEKAQHNVFNRCVFGPDGWLYGCNGIQSQSLVGAPGTPPDKRTPMRCGVWRYHPTRKVFEVVAHGTTNPWGLDWDDYGEMFITNCVIEHLFHVVPGGHYKRMYGEDYDKHAYSLMQSCADHIHWAGGAWQDSRNGAAHSDAGGGHAHAGCMVYLGDNWPQEYRNNVFMCNIHGNRVNRDLLEQKGSGYVAHHGKDFLLAGDPWFRGLNLIFGPDGGVFLQDWTDTGECHNFKQCDRTNGRIYKIVYGPQPKPIKIDVAKLSDEELVKLQFHTNDWYVRRARIQLAERAAKKKVHEFAICDSLLREFRTRKDVNRRLRAVWALECFDEGLGGLFAVGDDDLRVRAWGLRLLAQAPKLNHDFAGKPAKAAQDFSPVVRLAGASVLQRVPIKERAAAIRLLAAHAEDAADQNLPLMIWYAAAPYIAQANLAEVQQLLPAMKIPLLREYTARLVAERSVVDGIALLRSLVDRPSQEAGDDEMLLDALRGVEAAWKNQQFRSSPAGWNDLAAKLANNRGPEIFLRSLIISIAFHGVYGARESAHDIAAGYVGSSDRPADVRREVFAALIKARGSDVHAKETWPEYLKRQMRDPVLSDLAIRALGAANDPTAAAALIDRYSVFSPECRREVVAVLSSRPDWAKALLTAVKQNKIPKHDIDSVTVRQLLTLKDNTIQTDVEALWGRVRPASEDKKRLMAQYRGELAPGALKQANLSNGRAVYAKTCGQCHTLFDAGGKLGPELTGSQRANLDYVLENVLDPNAIVAKEYLMTIIVTADGRTLNGIVVEESPSGLTLKTPTEQIRLQKSDIEKRTLTSQSIMPERLFEALSPTERRDLVAYLASSQQAPLPK